MAIFLNPRVVALHGLKGPWVLPTNSGPMRIVFRFVSYLWSSCCIYVKQFPLRASTSDIKV